MTGEFSKLNDEDSGNGKWKVATIISVIGVVIALGSIFASGGAKSERLDQHEKRIEALEQMPPRVERIEVRVDEIYRRLGSIEVKVDKLVERRE